LVPLWLFFPVYPGWVWVSGFPTPTLIINSFVPPV
jgi:hypothetical protein